MSELETKVKNVIEQIRPYLQADGGDISFTLFPYTTFFRSISNTSSWYWK